MKPSSTADTLEMSPATPVGDLNSEEVGTGARFNSGKTPFDLVPIKVLGETLMRRLAGQGRLDIEDVSRTAKAIFFLGCYQTSRQIEMLYAAMDELGLEGWEECARVFEYGKAKYTAWNWAKGMPWSVPLACAVRHLISMLDGEANDAESKLPHRGHVFCNLTMLITYSKTYIEGDDLAPEGRLA